MKKYFIIFLLALLSACAGASEDAQSISFSKNPFIGGTDGVSVEFQDFRTEVFDQGRDPFDIIIKLENKGEALVNKDKVRVTLSGINPPEFGKSTSDLTLRSPDDIIQNRKDGSGSIIDSAPVFVEFLNYNYQKALTGASANFPIRADLCYEYKTKATSKLCVRDNLINPDKGGVCELTESKQLFNSGAPIHIQDLKQMTRSKDKIAFTFELSNVGSGEVFERSTSCDREDRTKADRVYLKVNTGLSGLVCTGLSTTGTGAEGFTTLYTGRKLISCSQSINNKSDYEQLINIEVIYDYEQRTQQTILVKSSGE